MDRGSSVITEWLPVFREYRDSGDCRLRDRLFDGHRSLITFHVRHFADRGVPVEDLRQIALIGLFDAIERFDPESGVRFETFASRTIDGNLKHWFRDRTWIVRPPRRLLELNLALRRVESDLSQELGRSPTDEEIAATVGDSVEHIVAARNAGVARDAVGLDGPEYSRNGNGDGVVDRNVAVVDERLDHTDERVDLARVLASLSPEERRLLVLRFVDDLTQEEIADRVGRSQSQLSRELTRLLDVLRDRLEHLRATDDTDGGMEWS